MKYPFAIVGFAMLTGVVLAPYLNPYARVDTEWAPRTLCSVPIRKMNMEQLQTCLRIMDAQLLSLEQSRTCRMRRIDT
jgi:hypothetical protein